MDQEQERQTDLVNTTDCLEAISVFKGWKNFLFIIVFLCLLLLQGSFWLVKAGYVKTEQETQTPSAAVEGEQVQKTNEADAASSDANEPNKPLAAVEEAVSDANQPAESTPQKQVGIASFSITRKQLAWLVRFFNFTLIVAAVLYCLTMLFSLKISMLGRLGGINHICRAFFLSLVFVVLLLPWQKFFGGVVAGAIYTPQELFSSSAAVKEGEIFSQILHYLRFSGYWVIVMLLFIFSQLRSARWAKATLRRLELI